MFVIKECGDELFIATASEAIIPKAIALDDGIRAINVDCDDEGGDR